MFSTILFDIDGTIIDTEDVIISSLQEAVSQITGQQMSPADLRFVLGIPSAVALDQLNLPEATRNKVDNLWTTLLLERQRTVTVFATMRRTLAHLQHRGVHLGIITSKDSSELANEFDRFGLSNYFDVIITAGDGIAPKPSGEPITHALNQIGQSSEDALYIGDSIYDMQSAQNAGVAFALATWGAYDISRFQNADYLLNRPENILDLATIA